jgi:hypothetical protein
MAYSNQSDSFEFDYTPGYTKNTHEYGTEFGDEFHAPAVAELLASMVAYRQRGVTLAAGQGVLPTGSVLARHTASGKYFLFNQGASDGRQTAVGVLRDGRDTGGPGYSSLTNYNSGNVDAITLSGGSATFAASPSGKVQVDCQGNLVYSGSLNLSLLSGTDVGNLVTGAAGGFGSTSSQAQGQLGGRVVTFGNGIGTPPFAGSAMDNGNKAIFIF